jgi:hypothetical protein
MSLHKFADMVAKQGRGDDSLLIHMTPDEVQRLQAFAEANGRSLTINPNTGLPEAGMLSDLFKAVAPIALGAFLGPAGMGITFGGLSSAVSAGIATGGIATLATGSLSRGLMAGLGAYGGAGLGESLMNAGTASLGSQAAGQSYLANAIPSAIEGASAGLSGDMAYNLADAGINTAGEAAASAANQASADAIKNASMFDKLGAGAQTAMANPMQFAKDNWKYLAGAAAPIAADLMTPTTTKMPELGNTGYIRQKVYDPYTQTYRSMAPVKANEWKDRQFSDIYRGASGGIVALAHGGAVQHFDDGGGVTDQQVKDWFVANQGASDADIAKAMGEFKVGTEQIARATGTMDQLGDYNTRFVQQVAQPNTTAEQFLAATSGAGIQNQALADALSNSGLSAAAQYAATHSDVGTGGGLAGLNEQINAALAGNPNATLADAQAEMDKYGLTNADVLRATGKSTEDIFAEREAAAAKAAADKAAADKAAADKAAADAAAAAAAKAAADKAAADAAAAAAAKAAADKAAADKAAADKAAADKAAADKAAADKAAADKAAADKAAADKAAADKAAADAAAAAKAAADKAAADKAAKDKAAADAAAAAAAKAIADGKTAAEAAAAAAAAKLAAERAVAEQAAAEKAARDKAAADAAAAANKITVDGTYTSGAGTTSAVGTKVGQGTISGVGTLADTGTKGAIVDFGGSSAFKTSPLTLAQQQIATQAAATNAADKAKLDLYSQWGASNPNATEADHANFIDKIGLKPETAAQLLNMSPQQAKNMYYNAKYNKMTGDSEAAYNFLMGKGAYPTKSGVGEIMRPYSEATLGMPASTNKKFVFDPATKKYAANPDYVGTYRDSTGAVNYTMSPQEIMDYFKANQGQEDSTTYDWALENNLSPEDIASATGVPLSTVAAKWRDAKAKKDAAAAEAKATADKAAATTKQDDSSTGGNANGGLMKLAMGGMPAYAVGGGLGSLGSYSDGGRLLKGPGDGVSDSIPATIGAKQQPARLADGEFVIPARIVSELGNGSTEAGARKLYAMMDRVQRARGKTTGKNKVAANTRADKHLPA